MKALPSLPEPRMGIHGSFIVIRTDVEQRIGLDVGADGSLTGYAGGLDRKRALLELEGANAQALVELAQSVLRGTRRDRSPTELVDLRGIYGAIRDGEATWKSFMDNKRESSSVESGSGGKPVCTEEKFKAKTAEWKKIIQSGKKPNDLIAMVESKDQLTTDQKMEIASWAVVGESQS